MLPLPKYYYLSSNIYYPFFSQWLVVLLAREQRGYSGFNAILNSLIFKRKYSEYFQDIQQSINAAQPEYRETG